MEQGAKVFAFDPMAKLPAGEAITRSNSELDACVDADVLLVLTEWPQFSLIEPSSVKAVMSKNPTVLDFRRVLDPKSWKQHFENFQLVGQ